MSVTESPAHIPFEVQVAAERFDGASKGDLVGALTGALDQVYFLRGLFAWSAVELERALAYRGFSASRRSFGERQAELARRAARGDAEKVKFDRQSHYVDRAARSENITLLLDLTLPKLPTSSDVAGEHYDLRVGAGYAYRELLTLRQLAAYEAGVTRAHDIPSGPKAVRTILETIDRALIAAATADLTDFQSLPEHLRVIDRKAALRTIDAKTTLTNWEYLDVHGLSFA